MAEERTEEAAEQAAQPTPATEEAQTPAPGPDYKAQMEEWKANARKWERLAKANAEKAKGFDSASEKAKTVEERIAALESENRAYREREERVQLVKAVAKATGVSESVVAALNGEDEDALTEQAKAVAAAFKPSAAPSAPEAGKLDRADTAPTKESILAIKDPKERIRQIALNKELFERK